MLRVRDLSVSYGQHRALAGAGLDVGRGEIVVILGANGAGKTTLLKAICGISEGRVSGEVVMEGEDLIGQPPEKVVEAGIALVPEGRGVFGDLSVQENLTLGAYAQRARDDEAGNLERVFRLFPKLAERRRQTVRTMSGGEQQMVAIGRAMMSNPDILALDEPSLGLSPLLCKELFQSLADVRAAGLGILLVEQNAKQSLAIADRGYLLENGEIVHEDTGEKLAKDPAVQKAYLGGGAAVPAPKSRPAALPKPEKRAPAGPSPSDIAAAAMKGLSTLRRPAGETAPAPAPEPPRAVAPARAPVKPVPAAPPDPAPAPGVNGMDINALVARAASQSSRRASSAAGPAAAPLAPPAPRQNATGPRSALLPAMPDLSSSADRLKAALEEIEAAARRAEAYRPNPNSRDPRR
ncbi:ABC transporter ATP-binding protein [Ovoidimarina sediminis]|uniref:ABC transporter ATP-binding protein n=1 Tax=Ovoidimarina sediminis TaxID=3079856 RepID=UPI00290A0FE6|nr:ABC transporter ATP-binding protein [Rhodophyticola sp. MJ-SS7]MDU8944667.1 ABC transporter ATP-binding protein [Rhodophyticola sp. MJ-SS7]